MTEIEKGFAYLRQILAADQYFLPSDPIELPGGVFYPTGGMWVRLFKGRNDRSMVGGVRLYYKDRQELRLIHKAQVVFRQPWALLQENHINTQTAPNGPYAGYSLTCFVVNVPLRVSHSSSNFLMHPDDLGKVQIKMQPLVTFTIQKAPLSLLTGVSAYIIEHTYCGREVGQSIIPEKGTFEMFGFNFSSAQTLYEATREFLSETRMSIVHNGTSRTVLPQLSEKNEPVVIDQLTKMASKIASIRGEQFSAAPKVAIVAPPIKKAPPPAPTVPPPPRQIAPPPPRKK